jgi:hypothetical protein
MGSREDKRGAPLVDGEGMAAILMTQGSINLGPGKPGPGDEWKFPDATETDETGGGQPGRSTPEPEPEPSRRGFLRSLIVRR